MNDANLNFWQEGDVSGPRPLPFRARLAWFLAGAALVLLALFAASV